MAKEDFCFTYYDGDAARDMSHMDRLERGGYTDIIISQRKFGWLTVDQIKKVLGRDFDVIWPAIELVMVKYSAPGEPDRYYIEWLNNSQKRAKKHSEKQSANGKNGGRPAKNKPTGTLINNQTKADDNPNENQKKPLGDGDGNGNEDEGNIDGGTGEEPTTAAFAEPFCIDPNLPLPASTLEAAELNQFALTRNKNTAFIEDQWGVFIAERLHDPPERRQHYRQLSDITTHFINWIRNKHPHVKQRATQVGRVFESD